MMRGIVFYTALIGLLFSCGSNDTDSEIHYYPNGDIKEIITTGSDTGIKCHRVYYEGNLLKKDYCTLNGKVHGVVKFFFPDGELEQIQHYKHGNKNGEFKNFYPDGTLMEVAQFKEDSKNGIQKYYLPDGKLRALYIFNNDTAYYKKTFHYNDADSLISVEEQMSPILLMDDTIKVNEEFVFTFKLPSGIEKEMPTNNLTVKYDFVERPNEYKEKGYPIPQYEIIMAEGAASDSGRIKAVGRYTIYGHISRSPASEGQPQIIGMFEKNFQVIENRKK